MMRSWPGVDWEAFASVVDEVLRTLSAAKLSYRDLAYLHHIGISTLSRARSGIPVGAANYLAICSLFHLDPYDFLVNRPPDLPANLGAEILEVSRQTLSETRAATKLRRGHAK